MLRAMNALKKAVELVGSASELARQLGAPFPSRVTNWMLPGRVVPADQCEAIEAATSGAVTCEQLRPDLEWVRDAEGRAFYRERSTAQAA